MKEIVLPVSPVEEKKTQNTLLSKFTTLDSAVMEEETN
jgi:hypothetical protein